MHTHKHTYMCVFVCVCMVVGEWELTIMMFAVAPLVCYNTSSLVPSVRSGIVCLFNSFHIDKERVSLCIRIKFNDLC